MRVRGDSAVREELYSLKIPTIFVDNLPHQIRKIWLYDLFSRFGEIRDTFIPKKKSKVTGQSFAFVRFNRRDEATHAVAQLNESWFWHHKLIVKFARFLRKEDYQGTQGSTLRAHTSRTDVSYKKPQISLYKETKELRNGKRGIEVWRRKGVAESSKQGEEKNAKVLNGAAIKNLKLAASIHVQSVGNGWLFRSAIAKISRLVSPKDLEYIFRCEEVHNVQVKAMGGRFVIITFPDSVIRDSTISKSWLSKWFEEIKPWDGEQTKAERFVWLSCFGMPLNAWSIPTFKDIGSHWGHFIEVDVNTLKEISYEKGRILIATEHAQRIEDNIELVVEGKKYVVRVEEDDSFRTVKHNRFSITSDLSMDKEDEREDVEVDDMGHKRDEVEKNAELKANKDDKEINNGAAVESPMEVGTSINQLKMASGVQLINEANKDDREDNIREVANVWSRVNNNDQLKVFTGMQHNSEMEAEVDSICSSSGIVSSIVGCEKVSDSFGGFSTSIPCPNSLLDPICEDNIMVNEDDNKENEITFDGHVSSRDDNIGHNGGGVPLDQFEANQTIPVKAAIKGIKGKKKRKTIDDILGFSKVTPQKQKGGRNKQKCVVFRSAVAAAALSVSVSSDGIANRNRLLLNEAQTIWAINKEMGLGYDGDEDEVISKIAEMEAQRQ